MKLYGKKIQVFALMAAAVMAISLLVMAGCGSSDDTSTPVDYVSAAAFESDLNAGVDTVGKTVQFVVSEVNPDSAFGYNLIAGEHLNFVSGNKDPKVSAGDTVTVRVTEVTDFLGSWLIEYEMM